MGWAAKRFGAGLPDRFCPAAETSNLVLKLLPHIEMHLAPQPLDFVLLPQF